MDKKYRLVKPRELMAGIKKQEKARGMLDFVDSMDEQSSAFGGRDHLRGARSILNRYRETLMESAGRSVQLSGSESRDERHLRNTRRRGPRATLNNTGRSRVITNERPGSIPLDKTLPTGGSPRPRGVRPPRAAAITILCGDDITYAEAMVMAKDSISLKEIGISNMRIRRAATGGLIFEVTGEDQARKADELADQLKEVFTRAEKNVVINRPVKRSEIIISGLDDSIVYEDIERALATISGDSYNNIKIETIRTARDGLGAVWVSCPTTIAARITVDNQIRIGWTWARINLLKKRPLKYFKCTGV